MSRPKINSSRRQNKIREALEQLGHTDVKVWWEPVGPAPEMGGYTGGFMFRSAQRGTIPLGLSMREALRNAPAYRYYQMSCRQTLADEDFDL